MPHRTFAIVLACALLAATSTRARAQSPLVMGRQVGGAANAVLLEGGVAYVGIGPRIVTFDSTSEGVMKPLGSTDVLPGVVSGLAFDRDYLIAGLQVGSPYDDGALAIVNAVDPRNLVVVSFTELPFSVRAVAAGAGVAVAGGAGGTQFNSSGAAGVVAVVDTSDRTAPALGDSVGLYAPVDAVALSGDEVFVIEADSGTARYNVRRFQTTSDGRIELEATLELSGWPGGRIAVANHTVFAAADNYGLHVLTSGSGLTHRTTLPISGCATDVALRDRTLVVADACTPAIHIFDARVPTEPRLVGTVDTSAYRVDIEGDLIATGTGQAGSFSLVKSGSPAAVVKATYSGLGAAHEAAMLGDWVAAATTKSLADPGAGTAFERMSQRGLGRAFREPSLGHVAASSDRFYGAEQDGQLVHVFAPSGETMTHTGAVDIGASLGPLAVDDGTVLVSAIQSLRVLTVGPSDALMEVASLPVTYAERIAMHDGLAAVSTSDNIHLVDVRDPTNARIAHSLPGFGLGGPENVALDASRLAYSAFDIFDPLGWVGILDIRQPASPVSTANFQGHGEVPRSLALTESTVLLGSGGEIAEVSLSGGLLQVVPVPGIVTSLKYDPRTGGVLAGAMDGGVFELTRGNPRPTSPPPPEQPTRTPTVTPTRISEREVTARLYLPAISVERGIAKPGRVLEPLLQVPSLPGAMAVSDGRLVRVEGGQVAVYDVTQADAIKEVGRSAWAGYTPAVAMDGDLVAAAGEAELRLYRVEETGEPRQVGVLPLADVPGGVAFHNGSNDAQTVVIAAGDAGLLLVDVDVPATPTVVGRLPIAGAAMGVVTRGDLALVWSESWAEPVWVVDVSNRTRPLILSRLVGGAIDGGGLTAVDGDVAYASTCGNCVEAFDISDPRGPSPIEDSWSDITGASDLVARNGWLYAGDWTLSAVDYTTPTNPMTVTLQKGAVALALAATHDRLYVSSPSYPDPYGSEEGTEPLAAHLGSLIEMDIAGGAPLPIRAYEGPFPARSSAVHGVVTGAREQALVHVRLPVTTPGRIPGEPQHGCTFVVEEGYHMGVKLLDLSRWPLAAPGEWVPELCDAAALTVDGDLVYVSVAGTGGGADRIAAIRVVRLLEGGQAEVIRELDVPDELGAALWRPAVRDGVAYVVQRQFPSDPDTSRLITLDLRSDAVRIVDELRGVYGALAFGPGGMVYLASAEPARLISIDASDPSDLRVTDEQDFPELAPQPPENRPLGLRGVAAIGSALYAASERGLYVFDAQDPRHPRQAAVTPAIGDLLGWTDSALLTMECCARSDIVRVDLRRPLAPRIDARLVNPTEGLYPSMAIEIGGRLIVGWTDYGSYAARTSALGGMYVYPSP